jgi:hypothetical protein
MGGFVAVLVLAAAGEMSSPPMVESDATPAGDITLARTLKERLFSVHISTWTGFELRKGNSKVDPSLFNPVWIDAFADVPEAFATAQRARTLQVVGTSLVVGGLATSLISLGAVLFMAASGAIGTPFIALLVVGLIGCGIDVTGSILLQVFRQVMVDAANQYNAALINQSLPQGERIPLDDVSQRDRMGGPGMGLVLARF